MLARFDRDVFAQHPDLVLWQVGSNSVLRDRPLREANASLRDGLKRLREAGMRKMTFGKGKQLSRRKFIVGSAAVAGGGLALGLNVPFAQAQNGATNEVNVWVAIKPDDTCVIRIARSEMGQGTLTGLAQLVAEELECDWNKVTTEGISPGRNLASKRA